MPILNRLKMDSWITCKNAIMTMTYHSTLGVQTSHYRLNASVYRKHYEINQNVMNIYNSSKHMAVM